MSQTKGLPSALFGASQYVRSAFSPYDASDAIERLAAAIDTTDLELVVLFVSPLADSNAIIRGAKERFSPVDVVGCTTAGELSQSGYSEGEIVALGFPKSNFCARLVLVDDLDDFDAQMIIENMIRGRNEMSRDKPDWEAEFTFLLIDGLSTREDALASELAVGLGPVPLFGGSAGDGVNFEKAHVLFDGKTFSNSAILIQFRTNCRIKVFKSDHLTPTDRRMVVTGADPERRLVSEINAAPAAREYARMLGKDPEQLTTFTFAAHPLVVRIGGQHHVRAIQQVAENGDLVFFSAIDEGVVLTLAEPENMVTHLDAEMAKLTAKETPDVVLACDCVLRRVEAQQKQMTGDISRILRANRVVGFSTYGEQFNSMHVNQTLTGVAIYPPLGD